MKTIRLSLLALGLLMAVSSIFGQHTTYVVPSPENTVTSTQIQDLDRRIQNLEASRSDSRLIRIETLMEQAAKSAEANRQTNVAILVPVSLLTLEALFRLASAFPKKK